MTEESKLYKLTPTMDFVFKRIFGQDDSKKSLISLLNAILNGNPIINDVTILNTETQKEDPNSKASRLDIEAITDTGTIVNVELQCVDTGDLDSRSITYAAQLISQHTKKGFSYNEPKVISIWIVRDKITHGTMANRTYPIEEVLYCMIPNESDDYYTKFNDKSRIIFVHLSRFKDNKLLKTISKMMKEWAEFFFDPKRIESEDDGMKDAQYLWTKLSSSEQIKAQIRAREKYEMDKASEIATAKNEGLIEGEKKGIEKGLIEGEKKGIQKGKQEGLIEGEKKGKNEAKKELAQNMRNQGFEDTVITKCLNINIEELNKLLA